MSSSIRTSTLEAYPERYLAAWNQRDLATVLEVIHPKVNWVDPLLPAPLTDHDDAAAFFEGPGWGSPT